MDSRRDFLKNAALLSGGVTLLNALPASIQRALEIDPAPGSSYLDAEHVVILMQENRSFDHCLGTLRGVRGFNDPRAIRLTNENIVWLQTNASGETYSPFRLNIKETQSTWMGSLPHGWENQVDARNGGKYDQWLIAKETEEWGKMPLTLGYYDRDDIPFYYALADAFTVCDQNFCSSLTGTTPNRLYLWSGTAGGKHDANSYANIDNKGFKNRTIPDINPRNEATWTTFPERLEDNGISWRIYQNELSIPTGLSKEEDCWLSNFTDNPLEWFSQYRVRYYSGYQNYLKNQIEILPGEIMNLEKDLAAGNYPEKEEEKIRRTVAEKKSLLETAKSDLSKWSSENFEKLSQRDKNLHQKAFTNNSADPDYRKLATRNYKDGEVEHQESAPKGDVLYQFRKDVEDGNLPAVSWLIAPENFSDHPGGPWYGAWYVSEVMDILTQKPDVWKKTIFILCYDENDGYFDHVPPYVVPNPYKAHSGKTSAGIVPEVEFVTTSRENSIGLGFRVPLIIASPWSRGGYVCSEVFDHTSILQFLEKFLSHKVGKTIKEENISDWRRAVCGDLTSTFQPYESTNTPLPTPVARDQFMESIHNAQYRKLPDGYKALSAEEIKEINSNPRLSPYMPDQEKGIKPACALPYELYAYGKLNRGNSKFELTLQAGNELFGKNASGSPFIIYAPGKFEGEKNRVWNYAVVSGDQLTDQWQLRNFEAGRYHLDVYGPNGFFREFKGSIHDPDLSISAQYEVDKAQRPTGNILLFIENLDPQKSVDISIIDNAYKADKQTIRLAKRGFAGSSRRMILNLQKNYNWYDFTISVDSYPEFSNRLAGHVETGRQSKSDPFMGGVV